MTIVVPGDQVSAVTDITSVDGSVTITNPTGPTADLSAKGGYTLIAKSILVAAAPKFTFLAIPQTYQNLSVRLMGRSTWAGHGDDQAYLAINNDGGGNYDNQVVDGSANVLTAHQTTANNALITYGGGNGTLPAATADAGASGFVEWEIPGYALTTFWKTVRWLTGFMSPSIGAFMEMAVGNYRSTLAVTRLDVGLESGSNYAIGSACWLYGF